MCGASIGPATSVTICLFLNCLHLKIWISGSQREDTKLVEPMKLPSWGKPFKGSTRRNLWMVKPNNCTEAGTEMELVNRTQEGRRELRATSPWPQIGTFIFYCKQYFVVGGVLWKPITLNHIKNSLKHVVGRFSSIFLTNTCDTYFVPHEVSFHQDFLKENFDKSEMYYGKKLLLVSKL